MKTAEKVGGWWGRAEVLVMLVVLAVGGALGGVARGLVLFGTGNGPVQDQNWPQGSLEVANLETRLGWWEGPPFGGGQYHFLYRGGVAELQEALDLFGKIRAPELRVVVHEGVQESFVLKDEKNPNADTHVDWMFTVWDPESWYNLYCNPTSVFGAEDPSGGFRNVVDPPVLDVYVAGGGGDNKGIDWGKLKVPGGVKVVDERALAAGYKAGDGTVVRGDVYDMVTSKPVGGAKIIVDRYTAENVWARAVGGEADAKGHFEVKGVPAGSVRVIVEAAGYVMRVISNVGFGPHSLKEYTVQLARPVSVKGMVADTAGKVLAGVKVRATSVMGMDGRGYLMAGPVEAVTDERGVFELAGLPRGYLQMYASDETRQPLESLKVYSAPATDVALKMTATGTVKGIVRKADGTAAGGGSVSVNPEGERVGKWGGSMKVKGDGTFEFKNVPPGRYVVSGNPAMAIIGKDPTAKVIEVKAGETVEVEVVGK